MTERVVNAPKQWWDHGLKKYRQKRLNLERIPVNFRCPNCGRILEKDPWSRKRYPNEIPIELWFLSSGVCDLCSMQRSDWDAEFRVHFAEYKQRVLGSYHTELATSTKAYLSVTKPALEVGSRSSRIND